MNKYKVEITRTEKFIIDVLAKDEETAKTSAMESFAVIVGDGTEHYYQDDEAESEPTNVFDVTNTDDPFSPLNA